MSIQYDFEYVLGMPRVVTLEMAHAALKEGLLVEMPLLTSWRPGKNQKDAVVRLIMPRYYKPTLQDMKEIGKYIDLLPWPHLG